MKNTSILSCEHVHIRRVPGRTDAFITAIQTYLRTLNGMRSEIGSAEIIIAADGRESRLDWLGEDRAVIDESTLSTLAEADDINIRVNMCGEHFALESAQSVPANILRDGSLKDCVRYCALFEDEQTTSLSLSGLYRGAFLHGGVPFTADNEDILEGNPWSASSHRASFAFPQEKIEAAAPIIEELESRFEIEMTLAGDGSALDIEGIRLCGRGDVRAYRDILEKLSELSENTLITGALVPESDTVFALLRFIQEGRGIAIQTAVAEG